MLEEATPEDREQKQSQRKRQSQIAEKEHRGEELGRRRADDPRDADSAEHSDRRVKTQKEHSQQQAVKSIANSRGKSKEPKVHSQQQAVKNIANSRRKEHRRSAGRWERFKVWHSEGICRQKARQRRCRKAKRRLRQSRRQNRHRHPNLSAVTEPEVTGKFRTESEVGDS